MKTFIFQTTVTVRCQIRADIKSYNLHCIHFIYRATVTYTVWQNKFATGQVTCAHAFVLLAKCMKSVKRVGGSIPVCVCSINVCTGAEAQVHLDPSDPFDLSQLQPENRREEIKSRLLESAAFYIMLRGKAQRRRRKPRHPLKCLPGGRRFSLGDKTNVTNAHSEINKQKHTSETSPCGKRTNQNCNTMFVNRRKKSSDHCGHVGQGRQHTQTHAVTGPVDFTYSTLL